MALLEMIDSLFDSTHLGDRFSLSLESFEPAEPGSSVATHFECFRIIGATTVSSCAKIAYPEARWLGIGAAAVD